MPALCFFCLHTALLFSANCPEPPRTVETGAVKGKIVLSGKPVTQGKILFHPAKGKPVEVKIQADASYSAGKVPIGSNRVTVEAKGVPVKYTSVKTSGISVTIKKGKNTCNLLLDE